MKFKLIDKTNGEALASTKAEVIRIIKNNYNNPQEIFNYLIENKKLNTPNFIINCY